MKDEQAAAPQPGDIFDLNSNTIASPDHQLIHILKTTNLNVIQLNIPADGVVPTHEAEGEILLFCLSGVVSVETGEHSRDLRAGQLLYLVINEPFALRGMEAASVLATIVTPKEGRNTELVGGST